MTQHVNSIVTTIIIIKYNIDEVSITEAKYKGIGILHNVTLIHG